jgi:hypothetical protein
MTEEQVCLMCLNDRGTDERYEKIRIPKTIWRVELRLNERGEKWFV